MQHNCWKIKSQVCNSLFLHNVPLTVPGLIHSCVISQQLLWHLHRVKSKYSIKKMYRNITYILNVTYFRYVCKYLDFKSVSTGVTLFKHTSSFFNQRIIGCLIRSRHLHVTVWSISEHTRSLGPSLIPLRTCTTLKPFIVAPIRLLWVDL